jgi:hypothetical protein
MSRVAPTPPKDAPATMEEPPLGKSNLLINDEAKVCTICLNQARRATEGREELAGNAAHEAIAGSLIAE